MKIAKCFVYLMLVAVPAYSTILMRNTFEEYQGTSLPEMDWSATFGGNGELGLQREDFNPNSYGTQAHGKWSLWIKDPDNNSYAGASKTLTNSASEYMVEFYMWMRNDHATIDSFPLCVLWNVVLPETLYPELQYKTDIALVLDSVGVPPNGTPFYVHIQDANGWHNNVAHIHSTDRWFKIQIYRHNGAVDFYLDGDSVATFSPMNSNYVSNKIILGTTHADSQADGEVFYDDIIITAGDSVSLRSQETQDHSICQERELLSFLSEAHDYFSRIQPHLIYRDYRYFTPGDVYYVMSVSHLLNTTFKDLSSYERLSYFNELVVKLDQIKLGLLYRHLNETEKRILQRSLDLSIGYGFDYNLVNRKE